MKKNTIIFDPTLTVVNLPAASRTEALEILVKPLLKRGYVTDRYFQQVIQREDEFPTGLIFKHITVALPHANPEDVLQSACVIGRCQEFVPFGSMEAPDKDIPVELILVLALNDSDAHLTMLSKLMDLFSDEEQVESIRSATNREELCKIFTDTFWLQDLEMEERQ